MAGMRKLYHFKRVMSLQDVFQLVSKERHTGNIITKSVFETLRLDVHAVVAVFEMLSCLPGFALCGWVCRWAY